MKLGLAICLLCVCGLVGHVLQTSGVERKLIGEWRRSDGHGGYEIMHLREDGTTRFLWTGSPADIDCATWRVSNGRLVISQSSPSVIRALRQKLRGVQDPEEMYPVVELTHDRLVLSVADLEWTYLRTQNTPLSLLP